MWLAVVVLLIPLPRSEPRDADHFQAALDAARRREDQLKTLTIAWKVTTHVPKGGRLDADAAGHPLPREDQTWESRHSLVTDGDRFRLLIETLPWQLGRPDMQLAFDGVRLTARHFSDGRGHPGLVVHDKPGPAGLGGPESVTPINLWCRGARWWSDRRARVEARNREVPIDGTRWREFRIRREADRFDSYWLDVDGDYRVRRIDRRLEGSVEVVDVIYQPHPIADWAPHGWTETRTRRDGKVAQTVVAQVTDIQFGEPVPPDAFRLDPSPGETLVDHQADKTFRVRPDGTLEEINWAGGTAPADDKGPNPLPTWPARNVVRVLVIGGLAAVVLAAIVLRRRPRPPHTPSP